MAYGANMEVQGLEGGVFSNGDGQMIVRRIHTGAGCILVGDVGIYRTPITQRTLAALEIRTSGNEDICGTSVNDTSIVC